MDTHKIAREIAAKLIPHTTSVHNVDVIAEAINNARNDALDEAANLMDLETCYTELGNKIRELKK